MKAMCRAGMVPQLTMLQRSLRMLVSGTMVSNTRLTGIVSIIVYHGRGLIMPCSIRVRYCSGRVLAVVAMVFGRMGPVIACVCMVDSRQGRMPGVLVMAC